MMQRCRNFIGYGDFDLSVVADETIFDVVDVFGSESSLSNLLNVDHQSNERLVTFLSKS